jgi:hypothetical protein
MGGRGLEVDRIRRRREEGVPRRARRGFLDDVFMAIELVDAPKVRCSNRALSCESEDMDHIALSGERG